MQLPLTMFNKSQTNFPVPTIRCAFEDNGRLCIVTDMALGVAMSELSDSHRHVGITCPLADHVGNYFEGHGLFLG
jgi:hypothetical protein